MPSILAIRFVRILPMLAVLAVAAGISFVVIQARYSKPKAKEMLIKGFTWVNIAGLIGFGLVTLYAWLENNALAFDLMACFALTFAIGLAVTFICKANFLRHNPHYQFSSTRTTVKNGWTKFWDRCKEIWHTR